MFDHNAMNELKHVAADRYQRAGCGGTFKVHATATAYDKSRGYAEMSPFRQAAYRARMQFKTACDYAKSDFAFAPVAFDLAKEENRRPRAMRSQPSHFEGCEPHPGEALQRKADAPIKPRSAQAPCDIGLFGDTQSQHDLFDRMLRECFQPKARP